jgi:MFS family permease
VGRLSDRFDRRIVLALLGLGFAVSAFCIVLSPRDLPTLLPEAVLLGGFMSTLYPVGVANAHDRLPDNQVVAISGWLILMSGIGSVLGPLIGTSLMTHVEINGVFYFMAAAALLLVIVAGLGILMTPAPRYREAPFKIMAPQAGPLAHDALDASYDSVSAQ